MTDMLKSFKYSPYLKGYYGEGNHLEREIPSIPKTINDKSYRSLIEKHNMENYFIEGNEEEAIAVAKDKRALTKRLKGSVLSLKPEYRKLFKDATVDFQKKRLVSSDGRYVMQWLVRDMPGKPESPNNQQTNQGVVTFYDLEDKKDASIVKMKMEQQNKLLKESLSEVRRTFFDFPSNVNIKKYQIALIIAPELIKRREPNNVGYYIYLGEIPVGKIHISQPTPNAPFIVQVEKWSGKILHKVKIKEWNKILEHVGKIFGQIKEK